MRITVNGNEQYLAKGSNIRALLEMVGIHPEQVVTEYNGTILSPQQYNDTFLNDGDTVELIQFVGGG